jgi:sec-independent protein translocase protein TatA
MLNIGPQELLIILVIALIVVGPQRLPALGRSIGRGLRELRKAQDEVKRTIQVNLDDDDPPNGRSRARPTDRVGPTGAADGRAADPSAAPGAASDSTPATHETPPPDEIREISRSLGRSLAELRRAKEEVQRSFRIDPATPTKAPGPKRARAGPPDPSPAPADAGGPSTTPAPSPTASTQDTSAEGRSATPDRPTD